MSLVFTQYKKSEKTLKFNNTGLNKKDFHKSKQPIHLMSVNVDQIVECVTTFLNKVFIPKRIIQLLKRNK